MRSTVQIGIIGAGRIGIVHARTLAFRIPQASVLAIADPNVEAATRLAQEIGCERVAADYRELLEDSKIDAVAICSSTDTHARIIIDAARAAKRIFCEKPLDLDLERIDRVLEEVARAKVMLMLGFNRRFDPDFCRVHDLVAGGAIGAPHLLRITSRDPRPPPISYVKVSGGMFLDMTIHDFDMASYLMGCEVEELFAAAGVLVDPAIGEAGDVDTAVITLRFANNALGTIDNSRCAAYGYDQRVEVFGSSGMVANANRTPDTVTFSDGRGIHGPLPLDFFMQRYVESYEAEMRSFVECIEKSLTPPVTGEDGRRAIVLGRAALRSLAENRPVRPGEIG